MIEISSHERRALRAQAHHLHPVVTIGQQGITPMVLTEIDLALNAHGLIKVRVFVDDRDLREAMLAEIADGLGAAPVQHIGKLFVLWRPQPEPEPEAAPAKAPRSKRAKAPPAKKGAPAKRPEKPLAPGGRRARGEARAGATGRTEGKSRAATPTGPRGTTEPPRKPRDAAGRSRTHLDREALGEPAATPRPPRGPSAPNARRRRGARGR